MNNASTIKKICILPRDFSVATGELTPTLKLKRGVAVKFNQAAVDAIYNAPKTQTVVPYVANDSKESSKEEEWVDVSVLFFVVCCCSNNNSNSSSRIIYQIVSTVELTVSWTTHKNLKKSSNDAANE